MRRPQTTRPARVVPKWMCALSLTVLAACTEDPTAILLTVFSTELPAPDEIDQIEVSVTDDSGRTAEGTFPITSSWRQKTVAIRPADPESSSAVDIVVEATVAAGGAGREFVARRVLSSRFEPHKTASVLVTFELDCRGIECAEGIDCRAGRCVGGDPIDSGVDADASEPEPDAGVDAGPRGPCFVESGARCSSRVVISEVSVDGPAADEFVEIYNRSDESVLVSGLGLSFCHADGTACANVANIASPLMDTGEHLLFRAVSSTSSTDYSLADWPVDLASPGGLLILTSGSTELDRFGWGPGAAGDGLPFVGVCSVSYERKASVSSDAFSISVGGQQAQCGNGYDTDDNADDFVCRRTAADPQISSDPAESYVDEVCE